MNLPAGLSGGAGTVGGIALLGALAAGWSRVRAFFQRISSLLVIRATVEGHAGRALAAYAWRHFKRVPVGDRRYNSGYEFIRLYDHWGYIAFEQLGRSSIIFFDGWRPITIGVQTASSSGGKDMPSTEGPGDHGDSDVSVSYIRGLFNLDALILKAIDAYNATLRREINSVQTQPHRFHIRHICGTYVTSTSKPNAKPASLRFEEVITCRELAFIDRRLLRWSLDDIGPQRMVETAVLDLIAIPEPVELAVAEVRQWLDSKAWYRRRGIPWKRGWLIHGPPGNGKTMLTRGIATDMDLPVFVYDLSTLNNLELIGEWHNMLGDLPCIALIEDVDTVFDGRKNITHGDKMKGSLSFDCLLNCIDGVELSNGVFTIITTNDVTKLDAALGRPTGSGISTRPGRIDRIIELGPPDERCRRKIAARILNECPQHIESAVLAGNGESGAQFQDRCARIALHEYWLAQTKES